MVHEDDFCGERLRLAAFLRVVGEGKSPQRPARSRRRVRAQDQRQDAADEALSDGIDEHHNREHATASRSSNVPNIAPCFQDDTAKTTREHPNNSAAAVNSSQHETNTSEIRAPPNISHNARVSLDLDPDIIHLEEPPKSITAHPVFKEDDEATTRRKAASSKPRRQLHTRKKHRLPVNGLALVRTTSEIGLPSPGGLKTFSSTPITGADPIEDSQLQLTTHKQHAGSHEKRPNQPSSRPLARYISAVIRERGARQGRQMASPIRKDAGTYARRKVVAQFAVISVSDGFTGPECMLPTTKSKAGKRATERNAVLWEKKTSLPTTGTKSCLTLVEGPLPDPLMLMGDSTARETEVPPMQHQHSDIQIGFPATPSHSRQSPSEVVNKSTGAPSDQYLHHDEHVVINQLSCITAPIRSNSDSGESDSDEDPDERAHDSDNESDGTPNSSGLGGSIGTAPHTLYSQEEAGYFSEAMFGLQQRREGGDYFWSAYGSMV